jgi:4-hydroxy-tetrahydrodipicolinate reductase
MRFPRLALIGAGKMGRAIRTLALEREWPVVATLDSRSGPVTRELLAGAEVAIEFTTPGTAAANIIACAQAGVPVVAGTTGWDAERPRVERDVRTAGGTMLAAPNFALGMVIFRQLAEQLARLGAAMPRYEAHLIDTHHASKLDAPSGSARVVAAEAGAALGREIPVTSIRVGSVPGTHELLLDGPFEQIRVVHEVRDRRVFAEGALAAAHWLAGRKGIFTLRDMLEGGGRP